MLVVANHNPTIFIRIVYKMISLIEKKGMVEKISIFEDLKYTFIEETTRMMKYVEILLPNNLGSDNWDSLLIFLLMVGSIAMLIIARRLGGHNNEDPEIIALRKSEKKKKKLQEEKEKQAAEDKEIEGYIDITHLGAS